MSEENKNYRLSNDAAMPKYGDLLKDRYRIESPLGEGGFAAVFKAYDTTTGAHVAVKILDPLMSRRPEFTQRFLREVETISALTHYNTIRVTDKGETATGCLFLVMELLDGDALDDLVAKRGPMPPPLVRRVAIQVLRSLAEAHAKNIIHRDIKPANIFMVNIPGETDHIKVLDFGIAKSLDNPNDSALTSTGQVMCSPHYVAPERIVDHVTLPASDIYSLGVTMIELLEGKPPYESETPIQLVMKHARVDSPVPMRPETANGPLGGVLARATAKDLRQRYENAQQMLDDLQANEPTAAWKPLPVPVVAHEERSNGLVILVVAAALVLVALIGFFVWKTANAPSAGDGPTPPLVATTENGSDERNGASDDAPAEALPIEIPMLAIDTVPANAMVFVDGRELGLSPHSVAQDRLPAPPFLLEARLPDGRVAERTISTLDDLQSVVLLFPALEPPEKLVDDKQDVTPPPARPTANTTAPAPSGGTSSTHSTAQGSTATPPQEEAAPPRLPRPSNSTAPPTNQQPPSVDVTPPQEGGYTSTPSTGGRGSYFGNR